MIVDLFAGPGGWSEGLRDLGRVDVGIELDSWACATRAAAGHVTIRADVSAYPLDPFRGRVEGVIASPPCPAFSAAGKGHGRDLVPEIVDAVHRRNWHARPVADPEVWLVIDLGRWLLDLAPEWIALEQVPAVLPVWHAYAHVLRELGYSVWTGILNSADYGVPQSRRRAILIASRTKSVTAPPPTHTGDEHPSLFEPLAPWVTMAEALGWGMSERPGFTLAVGTRQGGIDPAGLGGSGAREAFHRERTEGRWVIRTGQMSKLAGGRTEEYVRDVDRPSPTLLSAQSRSWSFGRPATTIACDPRVWPPGHKVNSDDVDRLGAEEAQARYGDRAGSEAIMLEVEDALILQSFRTDYPVAGGKTRQFEQIGNAIPPLLARHILAVVTK